ncbi:rod shape-determining protein MreB [Vibrio azureus]|uniref:Rod shape-determining protein MreB n=1 Tax=Vibrio azureus NBRC 104587 TaxID=1219077 RepID=U3CCM9_9VIBR|nr:rod shape-determining protein [Vibrio azureus]AUI88005.1 rod shape-determining protein MreB [Vibrio azureus]GAD76108.1 hypothetical protein VAZ01S_036_00520 [Vibrio azureus NBRC 104587]
MSKFIRGLFSADLLVELSESKVAVKTLGGGAQLEYEPYLAVENTGKYNKVKGVGAEAKSLADEVTVVVNPFSHPRLLISDFYSAEKLIQHGLRSIQKTKFFQPSPRVIMHQLDKLEGGLTHLEDRVLRELAIGSGARDVVVYLGDVLDSSNTTFDEIKRSIPNGPQGG